MGTDCSTCCTTSEEQHNELNDDDGITSKRQKPGQQKFSYNDAASASTFASQNTPDGRRQHGKGGLGGGRNQNLYGKSKAAQRSGGGSRDEERFLITVVRLQSLIRGFLQRRKYRILKMTSEVQSKYFKSDEARETLDGAYADSTPLKRRVHTYKTGAIYTGQWKGGLRHGRGSMVWPDNARYEGDWQYNQACGQGKFFHTDGDIYDGQWLNNKANGYGIYTNVKGARYEGHWKEDQQHGEGVETWPEGAKYEGEYSMSKKEGTGTYTWADGSTYHGHWLDNKINGYGTYLWKDGRKYYGQWAANDMQGHGIYIYADGVRYDGSYLNDKKEGYGIYLWTDGRRYEGWWHKGKQHGLGTYIDQQKQSIKYGLWENGKRVKWFDEEATMLINQGRFDVSGCFSDPKSAQALKPNCSFKKPPGFDEALQQVRHVLNITFK